MTRELALRHVITLHAIGLALLLLALIISVTAERGTALYTCSGIAAIVLIAAFVVVGIPSIVRAVRARKHR